MDMAWRFRIMIFAVVALMVFGDFFGYGGMMRVVKSDPNQQTAAGAGKFQQKNAEIEISEVPDLTELSADALQHRRNAMKTQLSDSIKDSCLPKMLCEMAAKPEYTLSEKEKDLMNLIRSSSMSLAMNGAPSKWHFAAHMGELLRYTGDNLSGPMGCANLWPNCPISSKKLMKLSYKVKL
ncbi:geko [Haematobia irritans]|uniref:geko n=1 Tax=Haematobia irritans TaxID=7368 RepID=UPI003F5085FD